MRLGRLGLWLRPMVGAACVTGLALWGIASIGAARADEPLIKYNSNSRDYWVHPPADWFMGDETAAAAWHASLSGPAAADAA